jgi:hypothetical protein
VQVSDRRITWPSGSFKDGFVKAVVTPSFAISYTGVATLGSRRDTAKWIARQLAAREQDADGGLEALRGAMESACRPPRYAGKPLAVIAVGWRVVGPVLTPFATVLSNFKPLVQPVAVEPRFRYYPFQPRRSGQLSSLFGIGEAVREEEASSAVRSLERLCVSGRATARAIVQVLTECVREVSRATSRAHDSRSPTVSQEVLAVALPRPDLLRGNLVVGRLVDDWCSVTCVPAGVSRQERHGGPIIVGRGAAVRALEPHEGPPTRGGISTGLEFIYQSPEIETTLEVYMLTDPPIGIAWGWPGTPPPTASRIIN